MSRACRVCCHIARGRIDRALASAQSPAALARIYRNLSRPQIRRHRDRCLIRNPKLAHALRAGDLSYEQFGELLDKSGQSEEQASEIVGTVWDHLQRRSA